MKSQWDCIRENLGEWHGSFTQCSVDGQLLQDTPSILRLEESADTQTIQLSLSRFPLGAPAHEMALSFIYPGPGDSILFFETGAFVQGSAQWSPGHFGAEMAFIHGDRRLRLVQLFAGQADGTSQLSEITVIRETRGGCQDKASPPLAIADLQGHWYGSAVTLSPGTTNPVKMPTDLAIAVEGTHITQTLSYGTGENAQTIDSVGSIEDNCLWFEQDDPAVRVVLLPGGGSIVAPVQIKGDRPFFIESGWLIAPNHRQRLIRRFDHRGQWLDLTLVDEFKQES